MALVNSFSKYVLEESEEKIGFVRDHRSTFVSRLKVNQKIARASSTRLSREGQVRSLDFPGVRR